MAACQQQQQRLADHPSLSSNGIGAH
jgi:hypothetical protein